MLSSFLSKTKEAYAKLECLQQHVTLFVWSRRIVLSASSIIAQLFLGVAAVDLVEVCHPNNCNIGLLAYSPLAAGALSGKYLDINSEAAKKGRLNLFPGYMERYNRSHAKVWSKSWNYFILSVVARSTHLSFSTTTHKVMQQSTMLIAKQPNLMHVK